MADIQKRPDSDETQSRVEYTAFLLARRIYKSDIKRLLMRKYNIKARMCEIYISKAKELLIQDSGQTREQHRLQSLRFYESVLGGPDAELRDRMWAQERIDRLLGLEAPAQHEHDVSVTGDFMLNIIESVVERTHAKHADESPTDSHLPERISGGD